MKKLSQEELMEVRFDSALLDVDTLRKRLADAEDVLREIHRKLEALRTSGEGIAHKVIRHQARDYFERWR